MRTRFIAATVALFACQSLPMVASAQDMPSPQDMDHAMAGHHDHHGTMDAVVAKLSPAGQASYKQFMASMRLTRDQSHTQKQAAQAQIMVAMQAVPFNADALRKAFAAERAVADSEHQAHQEAQVVALSQLSTADRALVINAITKMHTNMERLHQQHQLLKKAG